MILTAIFCGLRASELRGLRWADVDLKAAKLHVRPRADRYNEIGATKSEAGERTLPIYPMALQALREWKLKCPKKRTVDPKTKKVTAEKLWLVFPNGKGNIENRKNIATRGLQPIMVKAGVTVPVLDKDGNPTLDEDGRPLVKAKYTGLHALRHFYASWCINRKADGGLELPLKNVQARIGHSSITMTADIYGHLFETREDAASLAEAKRALLAATRAV